MGQNDREPAFVALKCSCGRVLRAKFEQVGTEIRCWDCHEPVRVPFPNQGQRVARELSNNALTVIQGPGLNSILLGASIVTAILAIPQFGAWCSILVMAIGAAAYGESIRITSRGPILEVDPGPWQSLRPSSISRALLCLLMAAGTVIPLWILNAAPRQSPHWNWVGRSIAATAWTILPLMMVVLYARTDEDRPVGFKRCLGLWARHPLATGLALAVVPLTLLVLEVGLGLIFYLPGDLTFFALDYMPMPTKPEPPVIYLGIPYYRLLDYRSYPEWMFLQGYFRGLRDGYSFEAAIPASLSMPTRAGLSGEIIGMPHPVYLTARLLITGVVLTCLLASFAVQARWLGSLFLLERRRRA